MATSLPWRTSLPSKSQNLHLHHTHLFSTRHSTALRASRRGGFDEFSTRFDEFSTRFSSGQLWKDVWRSANEGFEQLAFEVQKFSERIDRKFEVSRRFSEVAESAKFRVKEIDCDLRITEKWRTFSFDFNRHLPLYRKRITDFFDTTPGQGIVVIFFLWFFLSGWLFRVAIFTMWFLPFGTPILMGLFGNILLVKGSCPSCERRFVGIKTQTVRCLNCRNIVWQPQGSRSSSSKSDVIDVEFEEK